MNRKSAPEDGVQHIRSVDPASLWYSTATETRMGQREGEEAAVTKLLKFLFPSLWTLVVIDFYYGDVDI